MSFGYEFLEPAPPKTERDRRQPGYWVHWSDLEELFPQDDERADDGPRPYAKRVIRPNDKFLKKARAMLGSRAADIIRLTKIKEELAGRLGKGNYISFQCYLAWKRGLVRRYVRKQRSFLNQKRSRGTYLPQGGRWLAVHYCLGEGWLEREGENEVS